MSRLLDFHKGRLNTLTANASVPQQVVGFPQGAPQYVEKSLVHRRGTPQHENDNCHSASTTSHRLSTSFRTDGTRISHPIVRRRCENAHVLNFDVNFSAATRKFTRSIYSGPNVIKTTGQIQEEHAT